jgi:hypothetical protein
MTSNSTEAPITAIKRLVEYLYLDEESHYADCVESGGETSDHIFKSVKQVADWLEQPE